MKIQQGDVFGRLTALKLLRIDKSKSGKNKLIWLFRCECGNETESHCRNVINRDKKSCGCLAKEIIIKRNIENRLPREESAVRELLYVYINSAKKRNHSFELSREYFNWIIKQNCDYCGSIPLNIYRPEKNRETYKYNGIDRVDNNIGYTIENTVPCCKFCNMAKRNNTKEEFLEWIVRLKTFNNEL